MNHLYDVTVCVLFVFNTLNSILYRSQSSNGPPSLAEIPINIARVWNLQSDEEVDLNTVGRSEPNKEHSQEQPSRRFPPKFDQPQLQEYVKAEVHLLQ